jgi:hypothetical protein
MLRRAVGVRRVRLIVGVTTLFAMERIIVLGVGEGGPGQPDEAKARHNG